MPNSRKFNYLLHPSRHGLGPNVCFFPDGDGDGAGGSGDGGGAGDGSGDQGGAGGDGKSSEDIAKMKEVVRKERELADAAEKRAKDAERRAEAAEKKAREASESGKTVEERLAEVEADRALVKLENAREKAVKEAISKVEKGFVVDREAVDEWLADANITAENVTEVVARAIKRNTKPDVLLPEHQNTQGRSDGQRKGMDPKRPPTIAERFSKKR